MLQDFSMDYFSLKGKVAIVTGGNTNLGKAYSVAFAKAGADIYIPHYEKDVSEIKTLIEETGQKVRFMQGDLTDAEYREAVVQDCLKEYGHIDILVNNAGTAILSRDFQAYTEESWKAVVEVNFNVPFFMSHRIAKEMIAQRSGKIINIGSSLSFQADCGSLAYGPTKTGILGLTRMLCQELAMYNIQVNTLCPGWFPAPAGVTIDQHANFVNYIDQGIPAGRRGELDDLMGTAIYLASRASDYLNGWVIHVDGGKCSTFAPRIE